MSANSERWFGMLSGTCRSRLIMKRNTVPEIVARRRIYECARVSAHVFGGEKIDGKACGGGQRHEVAGAEMDMTRQVGSDPR